MKAVLVVIAFVVLVSGIAFSQVRGKVDFSENNQGNVLSVETGEDLNKDENADDSGKTTNTSSYTLEATKTQTPKLTSTPIPQQLSTKNPAGFELNEFVYPGSEIISSTETSLSLKSDDNTDKITDWYKEKITSKDMNVKSFVTTKTNDNVLNKLVGANSSVEVRVEITKEEAAPYTQISINL